MLILLGVAVGDAAAVVMQMHMRVLGQHPERLDILGVEVIDPGLVMVDPDDGVVMGHVNAPLRSA